MLHEQRPPLAVSLAGHGNRVMLNLQNVNLAKLRYALRCSKPFYCRLFSLYEAQYYYSG
jgi:hypothetical protein